MPRSGRGRRARLVAMFAFALAGLFAQVAPASAAPVNYVALGDSYSAASGVLPLVPTAPPQCLRSTRNYPHVIAEQIGAKLTDVTCGAADTGDYFSPQYSDVPPQLDAVTADAELITMTIGGNDSGVFIDAIVQCSSAGILTAGTGSPCQDRYGSSFEDTIRNTTYPDLVKALGAVRDKAPKAKVAILGYPWITPQTNGCFPSMPVAEGDVPYLRSLQTTLNDAVRRAADATGAIYVDLNEVSEGHDACKPIGVRWVEPVFLGTNPVIVHPNALGESRMAEQAIKVLSSSNPGPDPSPSPAIRPRTFIKRMVVRSAKRKAVFRFRSNVSGSTFRCRIDRRKLRTCGSPRIYKRLKPGKHRFRVRAVGSSGLRDRTPATRKFRIRER